MEHRKVVEEYYCDINNLADFLAKLVNSYRLLVGGAGELNTIALAHKKDVRKAIKTSDDLLGVIDEVIEVLQKTSFGYMDYCKIKGELMRSKMQVQYIQTEIDNELKLQNSEKDVSTEKDISIEKDISVEKDISAEKDVSVEKDIPTNEKKV